MSLRMNLYGWSYESFTKVIGSKNSSVLKAAIARFSECYDDEPNLSKGNAWLTTLVEAGFPLAKDRGPPSLPEDGGLLIMQMETDVHVAAIHSLARAIAHDDYLDLAMDSSSWHHPASSSLFHELKDCGFTHSEYRGNEYFIRFVKLIDGTPLFGDQFRSPPFYSLLSNQELAAMVADLRGAVEFQRPFPETFANAAEEHREYLRRKYKTGLSEGGRAFVADMIKWFSQIQSAGQDAFILWS